MIAPMNVAESPSRDGHAVAISTRWQGAVSAPYAWRANQPYLLWHQGESNNSEPPGGYADRLTELIAMTKAEMPNSRFIVAQASHCNYHDSPNLRIMQASVVKPGESHISDRTLTPLAISNAQTVVTLPLKAGSTPLLCG